MDGSVTPPVCSTTAGMAEKQCEAADDDKLQ
jgi:hypothetical protein